jgi:hypothetical protein
MAIFAGVATALAGVLVSSISARSLASERTAAEQIANDQLEFVRSLDYAEVGLTTSNAPVKGVVDPNGNQSAQGGPTVPSRYTVTITIKWVDDSVPTSFRTYKNYKNVTVTVFRARDSKQMTQQSTQVGPRQRALLGGINKGTVRVQVLDYLSPKNPHPGVTVNLDNGPSSPVSDTTDSGGYVTFPGLDPASGSTYYDLVVPTFGGGWIPLPDATTTHFQLAAGAAPPMKTIQVYKPVTLVFQPQNSNGTPFSSNAVFTVTGPEGSDDFNYVALTGAPITVTSLTKSGVTILLPPGTYTITPKSGIYADPVSQNVPANFSNYPADLSASPNVTSDALGSIGATVTSAGGPVVGATVTVSGGPRSIATQTATTNASGVIPAFSGLPAGSGYTVTAAKGAWSALNQTVSVSGGSTNNLSFIFPTGHLKAVVTWAGVKVVGATVTLTGGPGAVSLSGTSDVNGEVVFSNVPAGSGYTMNAVKSNQTGSVSPTVVGATTTTVPVAMPTVSLVATVTWVGANVTGANVTLSGGPMSLSPISATTTGTGQVTFSNVPTSTNNPVGTGYTLAATKNGQTTTLTNQTVATSPTTSISVALPTGTIAINAAKWAGQPAGIATVTISGGPDTPTTYPGTTDASGVASVTVPATTAAFPYTVAVTKNGGSGSVSVTSLASGATTPALAPVLTPTKTLTITVKRASPLVNLVSAAVVVSITGGPNGTVGALPAYGGTLTTNASGVLPAITVPAGAGGYTVKVYLSPCTLFATYRSGSTAGVVSTGSGTNTAVPVNFSTSGAACPFSPLP